MHVSINTDAVLNSNPRKRLIIAFENLKKDYTEENAKEYMNLYKDQSLGFIIENSRYIFSEPFFGYEFYKDVINNPYAILITEYGNECDKVSDFVEEYGKQMGLTQRTMYESLSTILESKSQDYSNTITVLNHAFLNESVKTAYDNLIQLVYEHDNYVINDKTSREWNNLITESLSDIDSADIFYTLTPYLNKVANVNGYLSSNLDNYFSECSIENDRIDHDEWKKFIESTIIVSKLYHDDVYVEAVNGLTGHDKLLLSSMAVESVKDQINDLNIRYVGESSNDTFDCYYSTPMNAVNKVFEDSNFYSIFKEDNEAIKEERTKLREFSLDLIREYVEIDFYNSNDIEDTIKGYNFFEDGTSIEDAYMMISERVSGEPSKTMKNFTSDYNEKNEEKKKKSFNPFHNDDDDEDEYEDKSPKKGSAPKASLARKIQHSAMDEESNKYKKMADNERKGQEIKNAVKAVCKTATTIPSNVSGKIKSTIKEWDEADDEKRKKYMAMPGFRKKYFRNLKLALIYGATASVNPLLLPIAFMGRHMSKEKNKRIRNEYVKELTTEIKVCEEKIQDAQYNGDKAEKYKLMRIKGQLEQQLYRVKMNSKYA